MPKPNSEYLFEKRREIILALKDNRNRLTSEENTAYLILTEGGGVCPLHLYGQEYDIIQKAVDRIHSRTQS